MVFTTKTNFDDNCFWGYYHYQSLEKHKNHNIKTNTTFHAFSWFQIIFDKIQGSYCHDEEGTIFCYLSNNLAYLHTRPCSNTLNAYTTLQKSCTKKGNHNNYTPPLLYVSQNLISIYSYRGKYYNFIMRRLIFKVLLIIKS